MRRRFSFIGTLIIAVGLLVGMIWLGLDLVGRSFVPDGNSDDEIAGLSGTVTITRDQNGIPYITAQSENDAYAALGYAHAQDRLWQMDVVRRAGEGRLSEIFGRETIGYDAMLKTIGFERVSEAILKSMPKQTRAALDAYSRGVNAYIESHRGRYPMEFDAIGYQPEPWKPIHTVLVSRLLAWELNASFWTDIVYGGIEQRVDPQKFAEILPWYPSDAPTIIPGGQKPEPLLERLRAGAPPADTVKADTTKSDSLTAAFIRPLPISKSTMAASVRPLPFSQGEAGRGSGGGHYAVAVPAPGTPPNPLFIKEGEQEGRILPDLSSVMALERSMRSFLGIDGSHVGSNAWAIAGNRTVGGKPMLANDPHLKHAMPSRWYQVVMSYGKNTVAGVTIPGAPFVVIGRNEDIAWGMTSMMADETDFYIEQLDSAKKSSMLQDGRWEKLKVIRDTIRVKDSAGVPMVIRIGKHGPLISDVHPFSSQYPQPGDQPQWRDSLGQLATNPVAMRWTGSDVTQELASMQGINRARNLREFTAAARLGGIPSLSFVYADRGGNIAYVPSARIPIRDAARSNLPNPGWESSYNWKGYIPMEKLPTLTNPESGYIASANNKVSNTLPFDIGDLWEDPSRAMRLEEILKEGNSFAQVDFVQMQGDVVSAQMKYMVEFLIRAFPDSTRQGSAAREAISRLRSWDGGMIADGPEAAIVAAWFQKVIEMTYQDELGPKLYPQFLMIAQLPIKTLRHHVLIDSRWFDDVRTPVVETRDDILRKALGKALESLYERFGTWELPQWRYGAMHTLTFKHLFDKEKALRGIVSNGPFEIGGSNTTLLNGEWNFNKPYEVVLGPSMRELIDFADTTAFMRSVITSGASGQPLTQFYTNQTVLYLSHGYLALNDSAPAQAQTVSVTTLRVKEE
jgi:penicillin amidase